MNDLEKSLVEYHRDNLFNGRYLLDDGGLTTIYTYGVTGPDGLIYNVPGYWDGKRHSEREAISRAEQLGWHNFPGYKGAQEYREGNKRLRSVIESDVSRFFDQLHKAAQDL